MTKECYVHSKISLFSEVILVLQVMRHTWSTHLVLCLSFPLASCLNICTQMFYIKKLKMLKNKYSNFHFILTEIIFVLWFQHHVAFVEACCGWWVTPRPPCSNGNDVNMRVFQCTAGLICVDISTVRFLACWVKSIVIKCYCFTKKYKNKHHVTIMGWCEALGSLYGYSMKWSSSIEN